MLLFAAAAGVAAGTADVGSGGSDGCGRISLADRNKCIIGEAAKQAASLVIAK